MRPRLAQCHKPQQATHVLATCSPRCCMPQCVVHEPSHGRAWPQRAAACSWLHLPQSRGAPPTAAECAPAPRGPDKSVRATTRASGPRQERSTLVGVGVAVWAKAHGLALACSNPSGRHPCRAQKCAYVTASMCVRWGAQWCPQAPFHAWPQMRFMASCGTGARSGSAAQACMHHVLSCSTYPSSCVVQEGALEAISLGQCLGAGRLWGRSGGTHNFSALSKEHQGCSEAEVGNCRGRQLQAWHFYGSSTTATICTGSGVLLLTAGLSPWINKGLQCDCLPTLSSICHMSSLPEAAARARGGIASCRGTAMFVRARVHA